MAHPHHVPPPPLPRTDEPQVTVTGVYKDNGKTEMVVFTIQVLLLDITCIVPIPAKGTTTVPVHLKFSLRWGG